MLKFTHFFKKAMTPFETVEVICKEVIIVKEHIVPVLVNVHKMWKKGQSCPRGKTRLDDSACVCGIDDLWCFQSEIFPWFVGRILACSVFWLFSVNFEIQICTRKAKIHYKWWDLGWIPFEIPFDTLVVCTRSWIVSGPLIDEKPL
jgi:hypothetical protein